MYPLSSCNAVIFGNHGIISVYIIMMIYSMLLSSTLILGKLGEGRTSVQPEAGKACNLHWFGVYTEACWECQVVDCFTTLHTILDAIYATCVSIFIGSKQKPQSFDLWSSLHVPHLFGNLWIAFNFPLSNLQSTSSANHQRNLTITQVTTNTNDSFLVVKIVMIETAFMLASLESAGQAGRQHSFG